MTRKEKVWQCVGKLQSSLGSI